MTGKFLIPLLLAGTGAQADRIWVFEPGQALVSVELGPAKARLSATSLGMSGRVRELDSGGLRVEVRLSMASFATGSNARDEQLRKDGDAAQFPEIVFEGVAPAPDKDGTLHLAGTLNIHGVSRPLSMPLTLVRTAGMLFGHGILTLHLADFGLPVPAGASDEVRVEVDAGLRPEGGFASRG